MGFLMETRAEEPQAALQKLLNKNTDNISVTKDNVTNISAVSSCLELITSLLASLDFKLYKKSNSVKLEEITEDKRLFLLNKEPNYFTNSTQMKKNLIKDMILDGIGFINLDKKGNDIEGLYAVNSDIVSIMLDSEAIHKDVVISIQGQEMDISDFIIATFNVKNCLEANGMLKQNKDLFTVALRLQNYFDKNLKAGGGKKGIWKSDKKLGAEEFIQFKQDCKDIQETDANIVLNDKMNYTPLTNSNKEMQIMENMRFLNEELRELFGVPKILNEETFKTFAKSKLNPIVNALESAIDKGLLLEVEKEKGYCFKLNMDELTKANIIERFNAYKTSLDCGIETINEIRNKENLENVEGMDIHKMTIGQALFNSTDQTWFIPNTGAKFDSNGGVEVNGEVKKNENTDDSQDKGNTEKTKEELQNK